MKKGFLLLILTLAFLLNMPISNDLHAQEVDTITQKERRDLAQRFLRKMKAGFSKADHVLEGQPIELSTNQENILAEGEDLLFQVRLDRGITLEDVIIGKVKNQQILLSFRDFVRVLNLPIQIDENLNAQGWYVREDNRFELDMESRKIVSAEGEFELPDNIIVDESDALFPIELYSTWFGFEFDLNVPDQSFIVASEPPLPQIAEYQRSKKGPSLVKRKQPELPIGSREAALIDFPFVDVNTNSTFRRDGQSNLPSQTNHSANIRTSGDFLYGTLFTQSQFSDEDKLESVRATYQQESLEPELLGPLKARSYEVGDVIQAALPIEDGVRQELGVRITNENPLQVFNRPVTNISGNVPTGWDVELYRDTQFIDIIQVGEDGFYNFSDVLLYDDKNVFTLKFYGPQGQVREEYVSVPVDRTLSEGETTYDVSVTFDGRQTYRKDPLNNQDRGEPTLRAFVEKPIARGTFGSLGLMSNQRNGERNNVAYAGLSTLVGPTLIDGSVGMDDEADMAAELDARLSIGEHDFISRTEWNGDNFDTFNSGNETGEFFSTQLNTNGPLGFKFGDRPQYFAGAGYSYSAGGFDTLSGNAGFSTRFGNLNISEQLSYTSPSRGDNQLDWINSVGGRFAGTHTRFTSNYEIQPDAEFESVDALFRRNIYENTSLDLQLRHQADLDVTEISSRINWQAGFARISPSITYNSDNDLFAGLATSFGIAKDPITGNISTFDRNITSNGAMSVQVFLDENGDGVFNEGEELLEDIAVRGLQSGGTKKTNEEGIAFFQNMPELKRTDVVIEEESLKDPYWISGFEGVSVLPRQGYVAQLSYPIHISGEMDGTLYIRDENLVEPRPLKGIPLHLYNAEGEIEQTATTDFSGFYIFSRIPPGRYLLVVDRKTAEANNIIRPLPQQIEIGYDGTIIYGNDVYVEAGQEDVPSEILSDMTDYRERHPHIDFGTDEYNIVLNMGEFNSRLLMATQWYRLHTRYRPILAGGELLVQPQDSYADPETGKHTLRIGYKSASLEDAYDRCRALMSRGIDCLVEVYAGAYNSKIASTEPDAKKL